MKLFSTLIVVSAYVKAELGCRDGWDTFQGKCFFYSDSVVEKKDAKRFCWEQRNESQLLLISTQAENDYFAAKLIEKGLPSFWLRINDKKNEDKWVVDRRGYTKPKSWQDQEYFNWDENSPNGVELNSAVINPTGLWERNDQYVTSSFVCEGDFVEIEPEQAKNRNLNLNQYNNGGNGGEDDDDTGLLLKCWTCDAQTYADCEIRGTMETCLPNEKSCQLEVRSRKGVTKKVLTGCKAEDACTNNKSQNFRQAMASRTQCRPEAKYTHSACRQCCNTDGCNKNWEPKTRIDWRTDLL